MPVAPKRIKRDGTYGATERGAGRVTAAPRWNISWLLQVLAVEPARGFDTFPGASVSRPSACPVSRSRYVACLRDCSQCLEVGFGCRQVLLSVACVAQVFLGSS